MEYAPHLDSVSMDNVVDGEGEPADQRPSQRAMDNSAGSWHRSNESQRVVELPLEFYPEPWSLILIPQKSLRDICEGLWSELEP